MISQRDSLAPSAGLYPECKCHEAVCSAPVNKGTKRVTQVVGQRGPDKPPGSEIQNPLWKTQSQTQREPQTTEYEGSFVPGCVRGSSEIHKRPSPSHQGIFKDDHVHPWHI